MFHRFSYRSAIVEQKWNMLEKLIKGVGIHVLLMRSLFARDILRRLLRRVSVEKPTSAPLRY